MYPKIDSGWQGLRAKLMYPVVAQCFYLRQKLDIMAVKSNWDNQPAHMKLILNLIDGIDESKT